MLHDAWAIASHIALSVLTSLFPFLILMTALASLFGTGTLADEAADIILEAWPREIAEPIAKEVHTILTGRRSDVLTLGLVLALYFASSGVESLRVGLNRAYGVRETRRLVVDAARIDRLRDRRRLRACWPWRFSSCSGPSSGAASLCWVPALQTLRRPHRFLRLGVATLVIVAGLLSPTSSCPAGRRSLPRWCCRGSQSRSILWLLGGVAFGWYLEYYPGAYASTYGGLATAMVALIFLYTLGAIFLFGGELNGTIIVAKRRRLRKEPKPEHLADLIPLP